MNRYILTVMTGVLFCTSLTQVVAQEYFVSVRAHSGVEKALNQWGPTMTYLSGVIPGHTFTLLPYENLQKQLDDAKENKFQFLLTNPSSFVEISRQYEATALVTLNNKRQNTVQTRFGSVIFTRADRNDILNIEDLKGKHLRVVSPLAFGGWRVAWREILHSGIDPESDLSELSFAGGSQPAVVKAVQNGKADAGVVRTDMLERMASNKEIDLRNFRIIHNLETEGFPFFHSTPLYPEWPFAAMQNVSGQLASQVRDALLALKSTDPAAKAGKYEGWVPALSYQPVDDLLKELSVGPYKDSSVVAQSMKNMSTIVVAVILLIVMGFGFSYLIKKKS